MINYELILEQGYINYEKSLNPQILIIKSGNYYKPIKFNQMPTEEHAATFRLSKKTAQFFSCEVVHISIIKYSHEYFCCFRLFTFPH